MSNIQTNLIGSKCKSVWSDDIFTICGVFHNSEDEIPNVFVIVKDNDGCLSTLNIYKIKIVGDTTDEDKPKDTTIEEMYDKLEKELSDEIEKKITNMFTSGGTTSG